VCRNVGSLKNDRITYCLSSLNINIFDSHYVYGQLGGR